MKRLFSSCAIGCVLLGTTAVAQNSGVDHSQGNGPQGNSPQGSGFGYGQPAAAGPPSNPLFDALDTDGDGAISTRELRKAIATLKRFDTDKDGKITKAETLNNQVATQSTNPPAGFGAQSGFNNRGGGFRGDPRPGGPDMRKFDRNGDGQLSADEVPMQMRGMMRGGDQNGDGRLSASEIANLQQRMNERIRGDRPLPPGVSVGPQGVSGVK